MTEDTIEKLVATYIKMRTAIEELEEKHKQELAAVKEQFDVVSNAILEHCNTHNLDGFKTQYGTVSRRVASRYWTSDWDSMYNFILRHEAPQLLEQRIHNSNMRQFLEEHPDEFPVGMQADRKYTIQVRKPSVK